MAELPSEMCQVHATLERYVAIHDRLFKFSLRKAIPIPGLFKSIDYGQHLRELDSLASALEQLAISKGDRSGVSDVF